MIQCITSLLTQPQVTQARAFAEGSEFIGGLTTNRRSTVKNNQQVNPHEAEHSDVAQMIVQALLTNTTVLNTAFPRAIPAPTFSRYQPGMYYGPHMDEALMNTKPRPLRTDVSVTVFLCSSEEYDGGELELWLGTERELIKLNAGDAVLYPTGIIHQVRPVTRGARYVAVTWIQSQIAQRDRRETLSHYYHLMAHLQNKADDTDRLLMEAVRTSLCRMWMEI